MARPRPPARRGADPPGPRAHRRRGRRHRADPRAAAEPPRAGHVRRDVVGALLVQVVPDPPAPPAHRGARTSSSGPGESAGVVDVGDGIAAAFRIESHNHPSAIEPYQGAATGRRRASSAMCSRWEPGRSPSWIRSASGRWTTPAAAGSPKAWCPAFPDMATRSACPPSVARPSSTPPIRTTRSSTSSASGVLPTERLVLARASGVGNLAVLFGSSTGRDGIGGASVLASAGFSEDGDDDKRPSVQVGDPFEEKRLIEACLEILDAGLVVGIQDLGAAGITGAASETASKGGVGMDVYLSEVHVREEGMEPFEIMTSESQERMLAIGEPDKLDDLLAICRKWEIARVGDRHRHRVGSASASSTASTARCSPTCPRRRSTRTRRSTTGPSRARRPGSRSAAAHRSSLPPPDDVGADLLELLVDPVVGLPAVRPPAVPQHGRGPRRRRHRAAAQAPDHRRGHRPRPGAHLRRQPPVVRPRPPAGHRARRGRGA